jgi:hypothetical protein
MIAGLPLAPGSAVAGSVGTLLKQRGAVTAPAVLAARPRSPIAEEDTARVPTRRPAWRFALIIFGAALIPGRPPTRCPARLISGPQAPRRRSHSRSGARLEGAG